MDRGSRAQKSIPLLGLSRRGHACYNPGMQGHPKLILVEGMPGAGKSTLAVRLAERLAGRGERVVGYHEMADDNPIRTRGVDAMRAHHPLVGRLPGVGPDGFAKDETVYAVEQWGRLARRCEARGETVILESRYIQNSVQPRYMAGAPAHKVRSGFTEIGQELRASRPLLVYLGPSDVRAAWQRTLAERDARWGEWLVAGFSRMGWARERGLEGKEAVIAFYEEWERLAAELLDLHPGPRLRIDDPQLDWDDALERMVGAARPA